MSRVARPVPLYVTVPGCSRRHTGVWSDLMKFTVTPAGLRGWLRAGGCGAVACAAMACGRAAGLRGCGWGCAAEGCGQGAGGRVRAGGRAAAEDWSAQKVAGRAGRTAVGRATRISRERNVGYRRVNLRYSP